MNSDDAIPVAVGRTEPERTILTWEHVDFNTNVLTIPRTKAGRVRRVPMNSLVRELLRFLPSRLKSPWVFPAPRARRRSTRRTS